MIALAERQRAAGESVAETARAEGVPRSTAYFWLARKQRIEAPEALRDVFESPEGVALLHRIVTALHVVFVQMCACGVDRVTEFLRLSGLHAFVASSHGYHHGVAQTVEVLLGAYGQSERARLATKMTPRQIALCEDETFHPETCLVGMEPVSGFIVLERYAEARDAATWTSAMDEAAEQAAEQALAAVIAEQGAVRTAIRGVGDAFHLFDPATGKRQSAARCAARMRAAFHTIDIAAAKAARSERAIARIDKARRVAPRLALSLNFAQRRLDRALATLDLSPGVLKWVYTTLAPARYLERAARRARSAAERGAIRAIVERRLAAACAPASPLAGLDPTVHSAIELALATCFDTFVRSTACVEGRNGQLALQHHSLHRFSKNRLAALTVLHNDHIRRPDGSTAAERFFGQAPIPLFEWLLERLEPPARPRAARQRCAA